MGGYQTAPGGVFRTLIEHFNGSLWSVVPSPDPGSRGNELFGVAAAGPTSAWAVGQQQDRGFPSLALVEHWDGLAWRVQSAPRSASMTYDPYAAATRGGALLAAGDQENDSAPQRTLSFTASAVISSVNVGVGENDFYGLTASAAGAWAAGRTTNRTTDHTSPLVETLRNGAWSASPTPNPAGAAGDAGFGGISAASDGEVWAVGSYKTASSTASSTNRTLIERYVPTGG